MPVTSKHVLERSSEWLVPDRIDDRVDKWVGVTKPEYNTAHIWWHMHVASEWLHCSDNEERQPADYERADDEAQRTSRATHSSSSDGGWHDASQLSRPNVVGRRLTLVSMHTVVVAHGSDVTHLCWWRHDRGESEATLTPPGADSSSSSEREDLGVDD